jgi:hypothetical protein
VIIFTIIFGEQYVDKFFDITLNSIVTANNVPAIEEDTTLLLMTTNHDVPYIRTKLGQSAARQAFGGRIRVIANDIDYDKIDRETTPRTVLGGIVYQLLIRAIVHCIEQDECFCHVPPDILYSDGALHSAWALHQMTGKVVSIFTGRVSAQPGGASYYNELIKRPMGVRDEFVRAMGEVWHRLATSDPTKSGTNVRGHYLLRDSRQLMILTRSPNPFVGKFEPDDLEVFLHHERFSAWDHQWEEYLLRRNRLMVQTNLDIGMSIELDESDRIDRDTENHSYRSRSADLRQRKYFAPGEETATILTEDFRREQRFTHPLNAFVFNSVLESSEKAVD